VKRALVLALILARTAHAEHVLDRFYFRAGLLHMSSPLSTSQELTLSNVQGPASLAISDGPIVGSGATIDPMTLPAVIVGYQLTDRLSVETVLAAPLHVTFRATGTLATMSLAPTALGLPTGVPALGSQLGEADAAPPIATLVSKITDLGPLCPYAGAGLGVLVTYNAHATNPVLTEAAAPRFRIDPAPGLVLQTGLDLRLGKRVTARIDLKYIAFMTAHATVEHIRVNTPELPLFQTTDVGTATMNMPVNPLIVQIGLGIAL
jgi:outer membrane protein W